MATSRDQVSVSRVPFLIGLLSMSVSLTELAALESPDEPPQVESSAKETNVKPTDAKGPDVETSSGENAASASEKSVADLTAEVKRSLVVIRSGSRDGGNDGLGTGFVISSDGLIVTARHVIGDGREVVAEFPDGRTMRASEVYASSSGLDLAVVRIPDAGLPELRLGTEELITDGRDVVALGHPRGFRYSVVSGVISGRRDFDGVSMIQLAMPIEPGNSGGPVVDRTGRVLGIVTMKSTASDNVGFALPVNLLNDLLKAPNPVPMKKWLTIGALDPAAWNPLFDANWRQRAGRISVDGLGTSFGGRSLCLSTQAVPEGDFELQVSVRMKDERGAAGLAFHSDGADRHYGFYPSAGNMRLTRFDGPDLSSWTILHNAPHPAWKADSWNLLRVRVEAGRISCYVNGELVVVSEDQVVPRGRVGLATFRGTEAEFRSFALAETLPSIHPTEDAVAAMKAAAQQLQSGQNADEETLKKLTDHHPYTTEFFESEAAKLEQTALRMRELGAIVHQKRIREAILLAVNESRETLPDSTDAPGGPPKADLLRAALLIAKLDNEEVDVDAYIRRVDQMAQEINAAVKPDSSPEDRLKALDEYLFVNNGFRGSRFEYYTRSNSYLNEVIDDREGLPITLSVLYIALSERLGLKVVGVGLPGQFIVRYEPTDDPATHQLIDPFERGLRLTKAEAETRLREQGQDVLPVWFETQSTAQIIQRMLVNLLGLAESERKDADVLRYLEVLVELAPEEIEFRAKRLEIRARTGRRAEALADVNWFLTNRPEGVLLEQLERLRADLETQSSEKATDTTVPN